MEVLILFVRIVSTFLQLMACGLCGPRGLDAEPDADSSYGRGTVLTRCRVTAEKNASVLDKRLEHAAVKSEFVKVIDKLTGLLS